MSTSHDKPTINWEDVEAKKFKRYARNLLSIEAENDLNEMELQKYIEQNKEDFGPYDHLNLVYLFPNKQNYFETAMKFKEFSPQIALDCLANSIQLGEDFNSVSEFASLLEKV